MENTYTEVVCVDSIFEAIRQLLKNVFTAVIIDASLPEKYGKELLDTLSDISQFPILILSLKTNNHVNKCHIVLDSCDNNQKMYDIKHSLALAQQLICANATSAKQGDYSYTLAFGGDLVIEPNRRQVYLKGKKINLTRKEYDVLFCLVSNAGKILSREEIYTKVWKEDNSFNVDDLVKAHIKTLRKKLAYSDIKYIKNVWGVGYRFDHETKEDGE